MKTVVLRTLAACSLIVFAGAASAESYREVWRCKLEDDKKIEDVQAANSKWLAWVRDNVDKDIKSAVVTAVVGNQDGFSFVDQFPSLEVWAAAKKALDSDEGNALDEAFEGLFECERNALMKYEPTE